jgi:Ca2+-binding RTX toxin-like protein
MADIIGTENSDTINGTPEDDLIQGLGGNDLLRGRGDDDWLEGGTGRDTLEGGAGHDFLFGGDGNDRLVGGAGRDYLEGGTGADRMIGGSGNDEYDVDHEGDVVVEGAGDGGDWLWASVDYTVSDSVHVESLFVLGDDGITLTGNSLDNTIHDGRGNDVLRGRGGDDRIMVLMGGQDVLSGGGGNDHLSTENFSVTMRGGTGDDLYELYRGQNSVIIENAGEGIDTVITTHSHTLSANVENLYLDPEGLDHGYFIYTGRGNALDNHIEARGTENTLYGEGGNDVLISNADISTTLYGGNGRDRLHVEIDTGGSAPTTTLMDFEHDVDTIVLTSDDNLALPSGNLGALRFYAGSGAGAVAQTDAHRIIYDLSSGNLYYDPDGTGATAQTLFAVLSGTSDTPDRTDFVVA